VAGHALGLEGAALGQQRQVQAFLQCGVHGLVSGS
jgi:hypothetical protein